MAVLRLDIEAFLEAAKLCPVLDVRSPAEYAHAQIPDAISLPLFTDEERKVIGTAYKQESKQTAIKIGLDAFGPKMRTMVEMVEGICKKSKTKKVLVHCWRGGMRSGAVAWVLDLYGFEVSVLNGGYKSYRRWVIAHWQKALRYHVIGGHTGSGKTKVLHELKKAGAPVLDLEGIALHKGSAFGGLDRIPQPTQEMFENLVATQLHLLSSKHPGQTIWVEDESQRIGNLNLPADLWQLLGKEPMIFLDVDFDARLDHIVSEYKHHSTESLLNGIVRIKKRLGGLETKTAVNHLLEGNFKECFRILLYYYDKLYRKAQDSHSSKRTLNTTLLLTDIDASHIAKKLLNL